MTAPRADDPPGDEPPYVVAVRALCEFTAKAGDLDLRFTPSPTAQDGILGHKLVAGRRGAHYQAELSLTGAYRNLRVRGRADGYDEKLNRLEEIKTFRGDLARMRANHRALHWAQAKVYGWLLCEKLGLEALTVALVYFDIGTQKETVLAEPHTAAGLKAFFEDHCERFLAWARQELAHRASRGAVLAALAFPFDGFRPGQRELAEAVYRSAVTRRSLLAQAPTGIGKTVGTVFPLLKAMPGQKLDKLYFLAAKTPGRKLALDALALVTRKAPRALRVLELVARDKACEHPDKACNGDSCPLAKGFYDRLPRARGAAVAAATLDKAAVRDVALAHGICPYYLSQDLTRWADAVVGDYNYYFDTSAMLHGLAAANQWRVALLVDEAHNLVERGRKMYSAELDKAGLKAAKKAASGPLRRALDKLDRAWSEVHRDQETPYLVYPDLPQKFRGALQQAAAAIMEYEMSATDGGADPQATPGMEADTAPRVAPGEMDPRLQEFLFELMHFSALAEAFGSHSLFDVTLAPRTGVGTGMSAGMGMRTGPVGKPNAVLCLRNLIPAPFLKERFAAAHASALFSATLSPTAYYTDMLGLGENTVAIDVGSPFRAEQLSVQVARHISTRWADRRASLAPIVALIARQWRARPGNYLAFLSSYEYLDQVADLLRRSHGDIPAWQQSRSMGEAGRDEFLARFEAGGRGIGFAVLGGPFAEGIDLPGERLIGAFIATLGLPQVNPVNEQVRARMAEVFGAGYDYAYLYPGLQKIVQAAGRVIRTPSDEGVVHLMDDRFNRADIRSLLPRWWRVDPYPLAQPAEPVSKTAAMHPDVSGAASYMPGPAA